MRPSREWKLVDGRPDPDQLAGVIAPIVQEIQPDLVILFGSAARCNMAADSDVDLVVVKDLLDDHQRILDVTGWISPAARTWIERHSHVPLLVDPAHYAMDVRF